MSNNAKNAMKHSENTTLTCLEAFKQCFESTVLGSKIRLSAQMSNMFWGFSRISWKSGSRLKKIRFSSQMSNNAEKNTLKHPENTNKTCFEAFWEILENPFLGSKMWFSAQISNYAKIPWNTQKTPTKHVLRLFNFFFKSGSRPRCRTMLKILWNTQKTPTKHALRHFKKFLKIRFLAEKSGSRLICRIMLKYHETPTKHVLRLLKKFVKIRFSAQTSGSRLNVEQC